MDKNIKKNRLDLAYKRQLTLLNATLLFGTTGLLSFISTFLWNRDYLIYGLLLSTVISVVSYVFFIKINKTLRNISDEIEKLK